MDLFTSDDNDQDYYVEYESGDDARNWSSGDEDEYNHELENSTESFENEMNKIRENIERKRSLNDEDFEMQDEIYVGQDPNDRKPKKMDCNMEGPSNDDLLYDPDVDVDNEKWIKSERQKHIPKKAQNSQENDNNVDNSKSEKNASGSIKSDAILNCPACMITVCIDCQRHEAYKTQYRAMFVMHCTVDRGEILRYEKKHKGKKRKTQNCPGKLVPADDNNDMDTELFNPVKCTECGTVIAVYDSDEVYHFFNVLASQA